MTPGISIAPYTIQTYWTKWAYKTKPILWRGMNIRMNSGNNVFIIIWKKYFDNHMEWPVYFRPQYEARPCVARFFIPQSRRYITYIYTVIDFIYNCTTKHYYRSSTCIYILQCSMICHTLLFVISFREYALRILSFFGDDFYNTIWGLTYDWN